MFTHDKVTTVTHKAVLALEVQFNVKWGSGKKGSERCKR